MTTINSNSRPLSYFIAFLCCLGLNVFAVTYLQLHLHLDPCPLCAFQRLIFVILGVIFFVAFIHNAKRFGQIIYSSLIMLTSAIGSAYAIRHLWVMHHPESLGATSCGPGLSDLYHMLPLSSFFSMVFAGSGECSKVDWTFFGLSLPACALIWYVIFFSLGIYHLVKNKKGG